MDFEGSEKETLVTQVNIGGFDREVRANDIVVFLEEKIGMVDRCRLKTSWTPPESYPDLKKLFKEII
ncbi:hypothetical protein Ahy_A04g019851 [Arachis hypogaea]|uniref:RNA-dependent RNA polymerase 6-like RNA-binding domain-containing protein n=1 Tax=Arachis hypogaea TaxID=3818 RepID=A0A445DGQ4_ARAHY|nr:hypothetical protein Ahy_A04g019851 [Arachis hypogaea]